MQFFQPMIAQLGNFDCCTVLLSVKRCVGVQNFRVADVRQNARRKPKGLDFMFWE